MTRRSPLAVPRSTGEAWRWGRDDAMTPQQQLDDARNDAMFQTAAVRRAIAERNAVAYAAMRARVTAADKLMHRPAAGTEMRSLGLVATACPRCGQSAPGGGSEQRADWFSTHYNSVHGGYGG